MGEAVLTHNDFALIAELLETLQIKVVAEKFDVSVRGITKLLERRGTSLKEIRANYRDPILKRALANNESPIDIAEKLGVEYRSFYKLRDAYH